MSGLIFWVVSLAPLWVPLVFRPTERTARLTFQASLLLNLGTCLFSLVNSSDRSPYQWGSVFLWLAVVWLNLTFGIVWFLSVRREDESAQNESPSP